MKHLAPKFGRFVTWGACSRCGARVKYSTLAKERLTGLLVCTQASGRPVKPCLDPFPEVYNFQSKPDRSNDPPNEPLPARWGLDDIWSSGVAPVMAPDDATRLKAFLGMHYQQENQVSFSSYRETTLQTQTRENVTTINPASYDGLFVPSNSVRTTVPETTAPNSSVGSVPWAQAKGI
jgi:hypothetical protein